MNGHRLGGTSAKDRDQAPLRDPYPRVRHAMVLVCASVGLVFCVVFGIQVIAENPVLAAADIAIGAACAGVGIWSLLRPGQPAQRWILLLSTYAFFLYLFTSGGVGGNGLLWGLVVPLCTFFLMGFGAGAVMVALYFAATVLCSLAGRLTAFPCYGYESDFLVRFWGVYLLTAIVAAAYDRLRILTLNSVLRETRLREEAEAGLQEKHRMISSLLAASPNPIVIFARDGTCLLTSRSVSLLPGSAGSSGSNLRDLYPPVMARSIMGTVGRGSADTGPVRWSDRIDSGASSVHFETWVFPIGSDRRTPELFGAISIDRTEQETARAHLLSAKEQAEQANRAKSRFLASMSHEIRTPLNGIISMTDLLSVQPLTEEQKRTVGIIQSSGGTLLAIINDILDISQIEAGRMELRMSDFNPRELAEELVLLMQPIAVEKSLSVRCEFAPGLAAVVRGCPEKLRQVLLNLLGNGVKFTPSGEVVLKVSVFQSDATATVLDFSVRDTGIGIPSEKLELLFHRFTQIEEDTSRRYGGTGLGLAISRELVDLMGGTITVESEFGKGSEFVARLPFGLPGDSAPAKVVPPELRMSEGLCGPILLVDDTEFSRNSILTLLKSFGCDVDSVASGPEALDALKRKRYGLVLMDVRMPVMDGLEATRLIRDAASGVLDPILPIIALTADAMSENVELCRKAGMNDFIAKPFRMDALKEMVFKWSIR